MRVQKTCSSYLSCFCLPQEKQVASEGYPQLICWSNFIDCVVPKINEIRLKTYLVDFDLRKSDSKNCERLRLLQFVAKGAHDLVKAKLICCFLLRRHRRETQEVLICNIGTHKQSNCNIVLFQWDCLGKMYFLLLNLLQSQNNQLRFHRRNFQACKWCKWYGERHCTKSRWLGDQASVSKLL